MIANTTVRRKNAEFPCSSPPVEIQFALALYALSQYKPYALFMHTENSALMRLLGTALLDREASTSLKADGPGVGEPTGGMFFSR